jgi:protein-disulfide isomerase/peroxiredoxin/uncharacterized membrane protein
MSLEHFMAKPAATPAAAASDSTVADGFTPNKGFLFGILGLSVIGIGVSSYLVDHKLHVTSDPTYVSSCNLGGAINCDKVNVSGMSELLGLPISLYGIPTYLVVAYLVLQAIRGMSSDSQEARKTGANALDAIVGIGALTSLFSLFLALYSSVVVQAYCLYCASLYLVNFGITGLAVAAWHKRIAEGISRSFKLLTSFADPVVPALAILVIGGGGAWYVYDTTKSKLEGEYKSKIDEAFAGDAGATAGAAAGGGTATAAAGSAGATGSAGSTAKELPSAPVSGECGKPGGKKTEDGWTIYEPCLDEEDIRDSYGAKDAKVTVVKYSDFECPYCRYLATTMEPLKTKYKDKVRFVMKHFPMNPTCNKYMAGYDKHPNACNAHITSLCAGRQNKFWEMHDKLYANQPKLDPEANRKAAEELGLDMAKYDACVKDPSVQAKFNKDIDSGVRGGLNGAPRTYVNGRMVTGSASTAILEYYIQKALENPASAAAQEAAKGPEAPKPDGTHMIAAKSSKGAFYIDPYEGSILQDGKAVSIPDVDPAQVSWPEAEEACTKAGKRLCTEEEWVAACSGVVPTDNNNNGQFADDDVEGLMYPYGSFYEAGTCIDQEDKQKGRPQKTASKAGCRTRSGIFDLAGNIGEWSGATKETAGLMGGHNNSGERAACNQRAASFGTGNRNMTTGFRCCADTDVVQPKTTPDQLRKDDGTLVGKPVPAFTAKDHLGADVNPSDWKGKPVLINFFASWCGPCKKEFPELVNLQKEHAAKGFKVISIGVDREAAKSVEFAKSFGAEWGVIGDEESDLMGKFGVYSMPATFIVDRQGVIRHYDTGFKPEEQLEKLRNAVKSVL